MTASQHVTAKDLDVAQLVERAAGGDQQAWERLVDQYARLIWAMTRDYRLGENDAADVAQITWLRLLEHIDRLQKPQRVGSWLAATARNECLRNLAFRKKIVLTDDHDALQAAFAHQPQIDERLLAAEHAQTVRDAMAHLPQHWRQLLEMLMADPPASYTEISEQLGFPVGSIGPTRQRCLARLRQLLDAEGGKPVPASGNARGSASPGQSQHPDLAVATSGAPHLRRHRVGEAVAELIPGGLGAAMVPARDVTR